MEMVFSRLDMKAMASLMQASTFSYDLAMLWWNGDGLKLMAIDRFGSDRSAVRHPSGWRGVPDVPKGREGGGNTPPRHGYLV